MIRAHRHRLHPAGLLLAALALCLRLGAAAWAPPPIAAPSGADLAALLGEHALCLGGARGEAPPADEPNPAHDHDRDTCCLFHGTVGAALPPAPPAAQLIGAGTRIARRLPPGAPPAPAQTARPRARAPPPTA